MNGYILNLVTCFDNRGFTKHYDTKVRLLFRTTKFFLTFLKNKHKKVVYMK